MLYFKGLRSIVAKLEEGKNTLTTDKDTEPDVEAFEESVENSDKDNSESADELLLDLVVRINDLENVATSIEVPIGLVDKKDNLAQTQERLNSLILAFNKVLNLKSV